MFPIPLLTASPKDVELKFADSSRATLPMSPVLCP